MKGMNVEFLPLEEMKICGEQNPIAAEIHPKILEFWPAA